MLRHDGLFWRRFAYLGCVYGPQWWKRFSPPLIGAIIFALIRPQRRAAVANMARILDTTSTWRAHAGAFGMFAQFAHCFTETTEHAGPKPAPVRVDTPATDPLGAALELGRGAILVTGHFGNWDVAAATLSRYGRPVNAVMAREVNATVRDFAGGARENAGVRLIYSDTSAFSSFNMLRALRRNEIVAMQLDRSVGESGTRLVPFFGSPAPFAVGPFVLARLARAPIVPVFVPRLGHRHYAIRVSDAYTVPRSSTAADVAEIMARVVHGFEAMVREFPTQWFQFTPCWPPDGDDGARSAPLVEEDLPLEARAGG
jgi:lauroyl/myristoyl acyltransferase